MIDYNDILSHFERPKPITPGKNCKQAHQVKCPCHSDREASLTISQSNEGKILFHCHAGCKTEDILAAVNLNFNDLCIDKQKLTCLEKKAWYYAHEYEWIDEQGKKHKGYGDGVHVVADYQYDNGQKQYQYSKVRFEGGNIKGKLIRYYHIDYTNDNAVACKQGDSERYLYKLTDFLENRHKTQYAFIVEGEKDCQTLQRLKGSFKCVTTPGGASDWRPDYARYFKGLDVIILRDNDNAGLKSAENILTDLRNYAHSIRIVNPSKLDHGDVTDYLTKEGGTAQTLKDLCKNTTEIYFARWINLDDKGREKSINTGILAETISNNEIYEIIRNPFPKSAKDDRDRFLLYESGVHCYKNKSSIKAMIKEYLPTAKVTNAILDNTYSLLLATNEHVHNISEFDSDRRYINLNNGLLDIEKRQLLPHNPKVLSTIQFPFSYAPSNNSRNVFNKYIKDLCTKPDGSIDNDEIKILQEYLGFLISNEPMSKIKTALVLWSRLGNSGKSVFIRLITKFFGLDRVAAIKLNELSPKNSFILGTLPECRVITCGDESNSNVDDSSIFKSITGGDPVKVESKGVQGYSYIFKGGFVIACNGLPYFTDDKGSHLFNRLLILPCEHHISDDIKDARLDEKLENELPGIFNWALEGLYRLIDNGYVFTKSKSSEITKEEYHKTMDNVYRFITESYIITKNYMDKVSKKDFDDSYHLWASNDSTIKEVDRKNLAGRLESLGVTSDMGNIGDKHHITVYRGIKEKEPVFNSINDYAANEIPPFS